MTENPLPSLDEAETFAGIIIAAVVSDLIQNWQPKLSK